MFAKYVLTLTHTMFLNVKALHVHVTVGGVVNTIYLSFILFS